MYEHQLIEFNQILPQSHMNGIEQKITMFSVFEFRNSLIFNLIQCHLELFYQIVRLLAYFVTFYNDLCLPHAGRQDVFLQKLAESLVKVRLIRSSSDLLVLFVEF